jgi:hypothetical protein
LSSDEARKYLTEWAGIEFDPRVAKAALSLDLFDETENVSVTVE